MNAVRRIGLLVCLLSGSLRAAEAPAPLLGFSPAAAAEENRIEALADSLARTENLDRWLTKLGARPHHLGSPQGKENALYLAELFRSWGYETKIETFEVLFPKPRLRHLELLAPVPFVARLTEPRLDLPWSLGEQLPPYNAYSIDGDVTGELVYVNYGLPADYEELARRGITLAGRIALARYGQAWRGIKPRLAAEHGAVGCILFSDPDLDGYALGEVYPAGAYRPEQGVQRGSVIDLGAYPGDPETPFVASTPGARRLPRGAAASLTRLPVLPISYGDALPLLRALGGPVAPQSWRGALPIPYRTGPGPARVRLQLAFDWERVPAYDVIALLAGAERPEQWVVRGNHHDAWVAGGTDPLSGLVPMLEEARLAGELARLGHRPRRTLVYAAWDGEEPGFLGSTEWAEAHAEELSRGAVAYLNTDSNARGFLLGGGSPVLEQLFNEAARDVADPQAGVSVLRRALAQMEIEGAPPGEPTLSRAARDAVEGLERLVLEPLGAGSDFSAFVSHLGIPALDFSFCCESDYGVYHSAYDTVAHFRRFVDPSFEYGLARAQLGLRLVLRLANAEVLPFELGTLSARLDAAVTGLAEHSALLRRQTTRQNRWIDAGLDRMVADRRVPFVPRARRPPVPHLDLSPLRNALTALRSAGERFDRAAASLAERALPLAPAAAAEVDRALIALERTLIRPEGLPGRPWYRHVVVAPGLDTGYAARILPGVAEAIEARDFATAADQIRVAAGALAAFAAQAAVAAEKLERALAAR